MNANDDYVNPGPFTRLPVYQPVHPEVTAAHKQTLRDEARQDRARDREHLEKLDQDALMELASECELPVYGSREHLIARLLGEVEPSGPRFAS